MNAIAILGGSGGAGERQGAAAAVSIGLWVFMGVVTALFSLFITAYVMRMDASDWSVIALPWQLWLSTALLVAGSVALQLASGVVKRGNRARVRVLLLAGGALALAFLAVQLWAWQALLAIHVVPAGNPAASFFYLLTALHGLHVAGGLVAWVVTARGFLLDGGAAAQSPPGRPKVTGAPSGGSEVHEVTSVGATHAWRIALCARYWHFLLALWLLLFATLGGLTPAVVRFICGTN